jgi:hypothetical protein
MEFIQIYTTRLAFTPQLFWTHTLKTLRHLWTQIIRKRQLTIRMRRLLWKGHRSGIHNISWPRVPKMESNYGSTASKKGQEGGQDTDFLLRLTQILPIWTNSAVSSVWPRMSWILSPITGSFSSVRNILDGEIGWKKKACGKEKTGLWKAA